MASIAAAVTSAITAPEHQAPHGDPDVVVRGDRPIPVTPVRWFIRLFTWCTRGRALPSARSDAYRIAGLDALRTPSPPVLSSRRRANHTTWWIRLVALWLAHGEFCAEASR